MFCYKSKNQIYKENFIFHFPVFWPSWELILPGISFRGHGILLIFHGNGIKTSYSIYYMRLLSIIIHNYTLIKILNFHLPVSHFWNILWRFNFVVVWYWKVSWGLNFAERYFRKVLQQLISRYGAKTAKFVKFVKFLSHEIRSLNHLTANSQCTCHMIERVSRRYSAFHR